MWWITRLRWTVRSLLWRWNNCGACVKSTFLLLSFYFSHSPFVIPAFCLLDIPVAPAFPHAPPTLGRSASSMVSSPYGASRRLFPWFHPRHASPPPSLHTAFPSLITRFILCSGRFSGAVRSEGSWQSALQSPLQISTRSGPRTPYSPLHRSRLLILSCRLLTLISCITTKC
jgi:hypothetical protein